MYWTIDYAIQQQSIQACIDEGYLHEIDPDTATFTLWALAHGAVSLIIRKRIPYPQEGSQEFANAAIDLFMDSMKHWSAGILPALCRQDVGAPICEKYSFIIT